MGADLVTNDHNLHKIAQVHQIQVLNINELADALRPTVYVGETRLIDNGILNPAAR